MVAAAVVGGSVIGVAGSAIVGSEAANATEDAAAQSSQTELKMFNQNREDLKPYRQVGTSALNQLAKLYGVQAEAQPMGFDDFLKSDKYATQGQPPVDFGEDPRVQRLMGALNMNFGSGGDPTARQQYDQYVADFNSNRPQASNAPDYSEFYKSPDYNFAYDQGMRATNQSLAKRGLTGSGAEMKELSRFGSGLASQQFGNYKNSLAALAGVGQSATNQTAMMGAQTAMNIGANQRSAGDARASSYLNTGTAINNVGSSIGQYGLLKAAGYV